MRLYQLDRLMGERELGIGDRVEVRGGFGLEAPVVVTVLGFGEKNGRRLFDYDAGGCSRWAYFDQVVRIVR
jgi:hypothetical protein